MCKSYVSPTNLAAIEQSLNINFTAELRRLIFMLIYLFTAIGLTPGGNSTVHIYTQTIHRTTQLTTTLNM